MTWDINNNQPAEQLYVTLIHNGEEQQVKIEDAHAKIQEITAELDSYKITVNGVETSYFDLNLSANDAIDIINTQPVATFKLAGEDERIMLIADLTVEFVMAEAKRKEWNRAVIKRNGVKIDDPSDFNVEANDVISAEAFLKWGWI